MCTHLPLHVWRDIPDLQFTAPERERKLKKDNKRCKLRRKYWHEHILFLKRKTKKELDMWQIYKRILSRSRRKKRPSHYILNIQFQRSSNWLGFNSVLNRLRKTDFVTPANNKAVWRHFSSVFKTLFTTLKHSTGRPDERGVRLEKTGRWVHVKNTKWE